MVTCGLSLRTVLPVSKSLSSWSRRSSNHDDKTVVMHTRIALLIALDGGTLVILQHLRQRGCGRAQTTVAHGVAPVAPGRVGHQGAHLPGELGVREG